MIRLVLVCFFCIFLSACGSLLSPAIRYFELQTPRPFGYVIGDEISHRIIIETRKDMRLISDSIPKEGAINRWLNLKHVTVDSNNESGLMTIDLLYQVFYAPNEVKMLTVPSFILRFNQAGKTVDQLTPEWHFTLSPLKELADRKDSNGLNYIRPDALPPPIPTNNHWLVVYISLGLSFLIGIYLTYLYSFFPIWNKRRIFKQALRKLTFNSQQNIEADLVVIHHAFNILNKQPLFKHHLYLFYQNHPEYKIASRDIGWFFDFSNQVLFAGKRNFVNEDRLKLRELCQVCSEIELGSR
jgi:mxaA protein